MTIKKYSMDVLWLIMTPVSSRGLFFLFLIVLLLPHRGLTDPTRYSHSKIGATEKEICSSLAWLTGADRIQSRQTLVSVEWLASCCFAIYITRLVLWQAGVIYTFREIIATFLFSSAAPRATVLSIACCSGFWVLHRQRAQNTSAYQCKKGNGCIYQTVLAVLFFPSMQMQHSEMK